MRKIWFNHWFSTAYNIINMIKKGEGDFYFIGTNENPKSVIESVCDEWYTEPKLKDDAYVDFCLDFCLGMVDKSERMNYNIIKAKQAKQGVILNGM